MTTDAEETLDEATTQTVEVEDGTLEIRLAVTAEDVDAAAHLFENELRPDAVRRFLGHSQHHLLLAYDDDHPVGMLTVIELTYPDRGTEMFIYDMRVAETHRGRGIGHALLDALEPLARDTFCESVWVVTGTGDKNAGARATFKSRGAEEDAERVRYSWRTKVE
ncbi:GNAT family N-acetyltransferase [Nocardioides sp.]|uniref:GNAT family N-acetyltransferase n=1 Tax=Nocardioides sp. TaxID=35761 RepID=UPI00272543F4|nr:GNAT family N-acetyltransferase [Nocardioides sp.]MDO9457513.1 GNAT family N-acetyltransferase [Nocardioides sp.]